jgi:ribonuclease HII
MLAPCHAAIRQQRKSRPDPISFTSGRRCLRARNSSPASTRSAAGRSPVILDPANFPEGLDDSKKLLPERREALFAALMACATVSVVAAPPSIITSLNILGATLWAMRQAVLGLSQRPDHLLIDGNRLPARLPAPATAIIGGDGLSLSIAAASIIAKVTRDRMCRVMHFDAPEFGFADHKGYATPEHLAALAANGPCRHHRMEFAPCAAALARRVA